MASKILSKSIAKRKKKSNLKNLLIGENFADTINTHLIFFRFLELEKEISEREQFLNEMTSIGQGQKYNAIIKGSIQKSK